MPKSDQPELDTRITLDPRGLYYTDPMEIAMINHLAEGYLTVTCSMPMRDLLATLKTKLNLTDKQPTWSDWGRFRLYMQDLASDFLFMLPMNDFGLEQVAALVSDIAADTERPDVHALLSTETNEPMLVSAKIIANAGDEE